MISLASAHQDWAHEYQLERARIIEAIGLQILDIQHVGSTSIPGVPAKPILDILVGVEDFEKARVCVGPMIGIGYSYRGEYGIPRRHYFVKGDPRTHHVHVVEVKSDSWKITLRFRDFLLLDPDVAREYGEEKTRLASLYAHDRGAYQQGKDRVVERILLQAFGS